MKREFSHPIGWILGSPPSKAETIGGFLGVLAIAAALYEVAVYTTTLGNVLPPLEDIARHLYLLVFGFGISGGDYIQVEMVALYKHVVSTLSRMAVGMAIGTPIAFAISVAATSTRFAQKQTDLQFRWLRSIPWVVWTYMITAIFLYSGLGVIVAVVQAVVFKQIVFLFYGADREINGGTMTDGDRDLLIEWMVLSGVSRWQLCRHFTAPMALPHLFSALRDSSHSAMGVLVVAEATQSAGLGALFQHELGDLSGLSGALATVFIISIIMMFIWGGISAAERRVLHWAH